MKSEATPQDASVGAAADEPTEAVEELDDPEFKAAVHRKKASFDLWVATYFYSRPDFLKNKAERARYRRFYDRIYEAFEAQEGPVLKSFYCDDVVGAAAVTMKPRDDRLRVFPRSPEPWVHCVYNIADSSSASTEISDLNSLLYDAVQVAGRVNTLLWGRERRVAADAVFGLMTDLLSLLDAVSQPAGDALDAVPEEPSQDKPEPDLGDWGVVDATDEESERGSAGFADT